MWIDSFFQWLLATSLAGCILTLVILIIKFVFGRHMSAGGHYGLWLFLIIKLVIPFGPVSSFSVFTMLNFLSERISAITFSQASAVERVHRYLSSGSSHRIFANQARDYSISVSKNSQLTLLFFIWLTGVAIFTVYLILQNQNTVKLLKNKKPVTDGRVLQRFESCKKTMGIRADIRLLDTDRIQIPMLYGVFTTSLLLPRYISEQISSEQLKHIFLHELAHYKRKDHFVNLGMCVLQIMHWFNPVIAFAFYQMRQEREAATDSLALSYLGTKEYRSYGDTIILFLSNIGLSNNTALGFLNKKTSIKKRIVNIACYHQKSYRQWLWGGILSILIGLFVLTNAMPQTDYYTKTFPNVEKEDLANYFQGYKGSFVLLDQDQNKLFIFNETKSRKRVSPDSTFKIYAALVGLQNNILQDIDTQLKWDKTIYPIDVWNRNHNLRSAMAYSVNWYFERVCLQVGEDKMRIGLRRINYGNVDISGGIKDFWLESSLKISPLEQVEELKKFDTYQLPFARRNIDTVKKVIKISEHNGTSLSGKTGTGTVNQHNNSGWFVGYVVKKDHRYYFATHIQDCERASGRTAKEITLKILKSKNILL